MKRTVAGVLAAFYLLQSTWLLHAGFDALFPRVAVIVTPESCCASACGCPADVRARGACCCDPVSKAKETKRATASAFDVAKCSGLELAMAQAHATPALAVFPRVDLPTSPVGDAVPAVQDKSADPPARAVEKVPL